MEWKSATSKALQFDVDGSLKPDAEYPYFALREDAVESACRATYWTEFIPKDMVILEIVLTAVGIATLMPDVLNVTADAKRYRFYDTIHKTFYSADHVLLYSVAVVKREII